MLHAHLGPANSNLGISNCQLSYFELKPFPSVCPSFILYRLFRKPAISDFFSSPLRVQNSVVNLNLCDNCFNANYSLDTLIDQALHTLLTQLSG